MATEQKTLTAKELMGQSIEELQSAARGLSEEIFRHRVKRSMGQLENTMVIRFARRNLARVKTVIVAKSQLGAEKPAPKAAAKPAAAAAPVKTATKAAKAAKPAKPAAAKKKVKE